MNRTYTESQARRDQIKDMLTDIRCAYRDNMPIYAESVERDLLRIASNNATMDQYGWYS